MSEALSTIPQSTIRSSIWFLEDDPLYATVKPYSLAFTPEAQIPRDNIQRTEVPVSISDLRGNEERFDLDLNGFRVLRRAQRDRLGRGENGGRPALPESRVSS